MANLITQITPLGASTNFGLRSSAMQYGTCSTAANISEKAVTCTSFLSTYLTEGSVIAVKFNNTNTAAVSGLKLNVNSTGAKNIKVLISGELNDLPAAGYLKAGRIYKFIYDGTYWVCDTGFSLVSDSLVFKGVLGTETGMIAMPSPPYEAGWMYRVGTAGSYAGQNCEVGDMVICTVSRASGSRVNDDFAVIQANVDKPLYMANNSLTDGALLAADGTSGKVKTIASPEVNVRTVSTFSGGTAASLTTSTYTVPNVTSAGSAPTLTLSSYTVNSSKVSTTGTKASLTTTTYTVYSSSVTTAGTSASLTTTTYTVYSSSVTTAGVAASLSTSTYTVYSSNTATAGTAASLSTTTYTFTVPASTSLYSTSVSGEKIIFTAVTTTSYTIKGVNTFTANKPTTLTTTSYTIKGVNTFTANTPTALSTNTYTIKGVNVFTTNTPTALSTNTYTIKGVNVFTANTPTAITTTTVTFSGVTGWNAGSAPTISSTAFTIKGVNTFTANTVATLTTSDVAVMAPLGATVAALPNASGVNF